MPMRFFNGTLRATQVGFLFCFLLGAEFKSVMLSFIALFTLALLLINMSVLKYEPKPVNQLRGYFLLSMLLYYIITVDLAFAAQFGFVTLVCILPTAKIISR